MREEARSSSSRIAFGALGRLRRHHCSAARICVFARSLTSMWSGRLTPYRGARRALRSLGWSTVDHTERSPRSASSQSLRRLRRFRHLRVPTQLLTRLRATRHLARRVRRRPFLMRFAYEHFSSKHRGWHCQVDAERTGSAAGEATPQPSALDTRHLTPDTEGTCS